MINPMCNIKYIVDAMGKLPNISGLPVGYNHCEWFDIGHVSKKSKDYKNTHGTRLYYEFTIILIEYIDCGDDTETVIQKKEWFLKGYGSYLQPLNDFDNITFLQFIKLY